MKIAQTLLFSFILFFGLWLTVEVKEIELKNYLSDIDSHKKMIVLYYKGGSENSAQAIKDFEELGDQLEEAGLEIPLLKIDASKYINIARQHKVRLVPAVRMVYRKTVVKIVSGPSIEEMKMVILKRMGEPYIEVEDSQEFSEITEGNKVSFAFFGEKEDEMFLVYK